MIKKTTKAIFSSGGYEGTYDWEGGIPLSKGDIVTVTTSSNEKIDYCMSNKKVALVDKGADQFVHIEYLFEIAS
jgi:hypothetical protein